MLKTFLNNQLSYGIITGSNINSCGDSLKYIEMFLNLTFLKFHSQKLAKNLAHYLIKNIMKIGLGKDNFLNLWDVIVYIRHTKCS